MITMTRASESTAPTGGLLLAFELGQRCWKLGFTVGMGQRPRIRQIPAGGVNALVTEIERAKKRLGLASDAPVTSCYEAGRDGFWLHRYLMAHGITNYVVDSSSIEVDRRARRAKTDRLDLVGLVSLLARYVLGDRRAWRVVHVPTLAEEDARHLPRTLEALTQDRTRLVNRLKSLLATQGVSLAIDGEFLNRLEGIHLWDGAPLPPGLQERLSRTWMQLQEVDGQIRGLKARRLTRPEMLTPATSRAVAQLLTVRAIGRSARRCWRQKSSAGVAFGTVENSVRWSAWCQRRIRVATPTTTKALRARGMRMSVASSCSWHGAGSTTNRTAP